ncbi:MAG TPA: SRPBCC family protein [Micromonospora sp.]
MRLRESIFIAAAPEEVAGIYQDYRRWPSIFPTIHGTRLVSSAGGEVVIDVDHDEGHVRNTLRAVSPTRLLLSEDKHTYQATFDNLFEPADGGTRFTVVGDIRLRGLRRLLAPLFRGRSRQLMRRYQLEPMKTAAESAEQSA